MPNSGILKGDLVLYKGVKYKVEFAGKTKFGFRAKLSYLNGTKEFWVNLSDITPVKPSVSDYVVSDHIASLEQLLSDPKFDVVEVPGTDYATQSLKTKPVKPKKVPFDLGPPDTKKSESPVPKTVPPNPAYATAKQIATLKKLFPNRSYAVPLEKLSFVEADKMIRARLAEV
jgi:hypothetical protein